jgi:hypothetical protein
VADVVKNASGKVKHEHDKLITGLKKDKLNADEVLTKIGVALEKDTAAVNEVKSWLKKKGASEETAEQAKNYVSWVRFGDGEYKDVLVETISKAAQRMAKILSMDTDDVEASMTSHYFIEVASGGYKNLKESQSPNLYLELLRKHFSRRAPVYVREKQQRPSLDVQLEDEDEDTATPAAYVTEEDVGRYHDFDLGEPEAKQLLSNLEKFIMTKEPAHGRGIVVFLNELIKNRAWAQTSDVVQRDYELAKELHDVNPNNSASRFEHETRGMTPKQKKEKITFSSQVYAYKILYPRLVLAVTDYMKTQGKTTDLIMLKNALLAVRSSKFKDQALEKLKGVPGYILEEHPAEGERGTYRKYRKVSSGGTPMSELKFASANEALQHLADLTGKRVKVARRTSDEIWKESERTISHVKEYKERFLNNKNPSEDEKLDIVKMSPLMIYYIRDPSEAVQLAAVRGNPYAISCIDNPTEKVQITAIKKDNTASSFVDPTLKVKQMFPTFFEDPDRDPQRSKKRTQEAFGLGKRVKVAEDDDQEDKDEKMWGRLWKKLKKEGSVSGWNPVMGTGAGWEGADGTWRKGQLEVIVSPDCIAGSNPGNKDYGMEIGYVDGNPLEHQPSSVPGFDNEDFDKAYAGYVHALNVALKEAEKTSG